MLVKFTNINVSNLSIFNNSKFNIINKLYVTFYFKVQKIKNV